MYAPAFTSILQQAHAAENGIAYPINDHQGTVVRLLRSTDGSETHRRHYDAWGRLRASSGTPTFGLTLGYTGERENGDGTVYLRARHYAPAQQRFLQRDSIDAGFAGQGPQGHNRYAYVNNQPASWIDPSRHLSLRNARDQFVLGANDGLVTRNQISGQGPSYWVGRAVGNWLAEATDPVGATISAANLPASGAALAVPTPSTRQASARRDLSVPSQTPYRLNQGIPTRHGRKWTRYPNPNGGGTWVCDSEVDATDVRNVLDKTGAGPKIDVFSGTHGGTDGMFHDLKNPKFGTDGLRFLNEDLASASKYNQQGWDVNVHDTLRGPDVLRNPTGTMNGSPVDPGFTMSGGQMRDAIHGGGECVMAWCYSSKNNQVFQQYNSPPN